MKKAALLVKFNVLVVTNFKYFVWKIRGEVGGDQDALGRHHIKKVGPFRGIFLLRLVTMSS